MTRSRLIFPSTDQAVFGAKKIRKSFLFLALFLLTVVAASAQIPASLNVKKIVSDPDRARAYALHQDEDGGPGALLVIDTINNQVTDSITVGVEPSDCEITTEGTEILVINTTGKSIQRIDLETLTVIETELLAEFSNRNDDFGAHVADGPGDILYYVDEQWGPRLRVYNSVTDTVLQTFGATTTGTGNDYGFGDIVINRSQTKLYGWVQFGDGAGWSGSFLVEYDIAPSGLLTYVGSSSQAYPTEYARDPLDSPILLSNDGEHLFAKRNLVASDNLLQIEWSTPGEIFEISHNGEIAITESDIFKQGQLGSLHTFANTSRVKAITRDYTTLIQFNNSTKAFEFIDLIDLLGPENLGLEVFPADDAIVSPPDELSWYPTSGAASYQVFLGIDQARVDSATISDPEYFGTVALPEIDVSSFSFTPGQRYFWRVVPIVSGSPVDARTRSFVISNVSLSRSAISTRQVLGARQHEERIQLSAESPTGWTASTTTPWISISNPAGSTPDELIITIDSNGLSEGNHSGTIDFDVDGQLIVIPLELQLFTPNYTLAKADPLNARIYAISQVSESSTSPAHLVVIDTETGSIQRSIPVGSSVTDLAVHSLENRVYITNWKTGHLLALDLGSLEQVQLYSFALAGPTGSFSGDVYRISPGTAGRLIVEEEDQWIDIRLMDTTDGSFLDSTLEREGGGVSTPSGTVYFHGDNNSSGAELHRFELAGDEFTETNAVQLSGNGSRTVTSSADGTRVFWNQGVFNGADLSLLHVLDSEVFSSTRGGEAIFTETEIINGSNFAKLGDLPLSSRIQAIESTQRKVYLFNGDQFSIFDFSALIPVSNEITPGIPNGEAAIENGLELTWSLDPYATSYNLYFGSDESVVSTADPGSPGFLGNEAANFFSGELPTLVPGQVYFWRVDTITINGVIRGPTWSFQLPPFNLDQTSVELVAPIGIDPTTSEISITSDSSTSWTASSEQSWIQLENPSGSIDTALRFDVDVAGLALGTHDGTIAISAGGVTFRLPVSIEIVTLNYTLAEADLLAPYIYAISQASENTTDPAHLILINTETETIERAIPVGSSVTDVAIHYAENRIYVTNWKTGRLLALDRTTLEQVQVYPFTPAGSTGSSSGDVYRIAAGVAGRIIVEEEDQWIDIRLMDTADGSFLDSTNGREGGGVSDALGEFYFHGDNDSSEAELHRFELAGDEFVETHAVRITGTSYYGSRRVVSSGDGAFIYWNSGAFDSSDLSPLNEFGAEVIAATRGGEAVFTEDEIFNGVNFNKMADLPLATTIQAVEKDQQKLYLFAGSTFSIFDFSALIPIESELAPGIPDGSTTIPRGFELSWSLDPFALSYDVYFGTDEAVVSAASVSSSEFFGNESANLFTGTLPPLAPGARYFWRVDTRTLNGVNQGETWSFDVTPFDLSSRSIDLVTPLGIDPPSQILEFEADPAVDWTASTDAGWINLSNSSGSTLEDLSFEIDVTGLTVGIHEALITISSGGLSYQFPVSVEILTLNYTLAKPDFLSPFIYAVSQTAENSTDPAHLIVINSETEEIERAVSIGSSVTDLEIHYPEDRIYLTNWRLGRLIALDRTTLEEVQAYSFSPPGSTGSSGGDVYRIAAGAAGRLIIEEEDQWIDIHLMDTADGSILATTDEREGGGVSIAFGSVYLHGDNNSSGAELHRFDLEGDQFTGTASVRVTGTNYFGSRLVTASPTGSRVFWNGGVFEASNLSLLHLFSENVISSTRDAEAVFTRDALYDGEDFTRLATLPVSSTIQAVSKNQDRIFLFSGGQFSTFDFSSIVPVSPGVSPKLTDGATAIPSALELAWTPESFARSYDVYFGDSESAVLAAEINGSEFLGNVTTTNYPSALPSLIPGSRYFWRIDTRTSNGVITGPVWSFDLAPFDLSESMIEFTTPSQAAAVVRSLSITADSPTDWTAVEHEDWLSINNASGTTDSNLSVELDSLNLSPGTHETDITISAGGFSYLLPVNVEILEINYTHAKPDLLSNHVYAISQTSEFSTDPAYLLRINTENESIERAVQVGSSVTDFVVHYPENRIYLTNWITGNLIALDRETLNEVQRYTFAPAGSVGYSGEDVYRIAAGPEGRLIVEESDQWVDIRIMNTVDGTFLANTVERQGGGVTSPLADVYFHGDSNSSGAALHRFTLINDTFTKTYSARVTGHSYYGSRRVVRSAGGSRICWNGGIFDPTNLETVLELDHEVITAVEQWNQRLYTTTGHVYNESGNNIAAFPFVTAVQAVTREQDEVYLFDSNDFVVFPLPILLNEGLDAVDSDNDSYLDFEETAFGADYQNGASLPKFTTRRTGNSRMSFGFDRQSALAPFQYQIETSTDLKTWTPVDDQPSPTSELPLQSLTGAQFYEYEFDIQTDTKRFYRVRVNVE